MSRATENALDALHAKVAEVLTDALKDKEKATPAMISQALKFLKDNHVDAPAKSKRLQDLTSALDDLDTDEAAIELRH